MITTEYLKQKLGYPDVEEHFREGVFGFLSRKYPYRHQEFRIISKDANAPYIYLLFDITDGKQTLIQAGFGPLHDHFEAETMEAGTEEALKFVTDLIAGERALLVTLDSKGQYLRGSLQKSSEMPKPERNQKVYVFKAQ